MGGGRIPLGSDYAGGELHRGDGDQGSEGDV